MCSNRKKNIVNRSKQIKWLVSLYNVLPTLKVCLHSVMIIKFAYALHFLSVLFEFNSNISDSHWFLCWKRMNVVCCDLVVRAAQNSRVSITLSFWLCDFGSACTLNGIFFTFIYLLISALCSIGTRFCSFEIECRTTLSCATVILIYNKNNHNVYQTEVITFELRFVFHIVTQSLLFTFWSFHRDSVIIRRIDGKISKFWDFLVRQRFIDRMISSVYRLSDYLIRFHLCAYIYTLHLFAWILNGYKVAREIFNHNEMDILLMAPRALDGPRKLKFNLEQTQHLKCCYNKQQSFYG